MMMSGGGTKIREWMAAGIERQRAGDLEGAEKLYRRVLRRDRQHPDAWHFLGVLTHQRGDPGQARRHIERALALEPTYADAHNNLGRVLSDCGEYSDAAAAFRRALDLEPGLAQARFNLGMCLRKSGEAEAACDVLESLLESTKNNPQVYRQLALARVDADRAEAACQAFERAIDLDPNMTLAYEALGMLLYALGRIDEAAALYRRWLEAQPENPKPAHLLAACRGAEVPERAADDYVVAVFDAFAVTFDEKLAKLEYRAPALVADAVAALAFEDVDILDAGCGTGLCGPLLEPRARTLIGVDLSSGMIDRARALEVYDELIVTELVSYMSEREASFDVIVSADTLNYLGALDSAMTAAAHCLRPGGALVFTLESQADATRDYVLEPHGRFAHSRAYVVACVAAAGLRLRRLDEVTLRYENRKPVRGWLTACLRERA